MDWEDLLELDTTTVVVSLGMYAFILLRIWKIQLGDGWSFISKIVLTILMLPVSYLMTYWQMNR